MPNYIAGLTTLRLGKDLCPLEPLTLGVEEEFLVVDAATGALVPGADVVLPHARRLLGDAVAAELNLCQIEVGTPVCKTLEEVRSELSGLRRKLDDVAAEFGRGIVAVGTHPFGMWQDQRVDTRNERYRRMEDVYQIVARQQVICGCHVHVGVSDRELAVATMNRTRPWLPALTALAANSPFWQAADTGFASYRLEVWERWPTSGMPPPLGSAAEYEALVEQLKSIEAIEDPTFIYWYVRPSHRFPTLEFRACDVCARVEDTVVLAGLTRALAWTCACEALDDQPLEVPRLEVLEAMIWRAARYGLEGTLISPGAMAARPAADVVEELLAYLRPGLEAHGDWFDVSAGVGEILRRGNGARGQRDAYCRRRDLRDVLTWARSMTVPAGGQSGRDVRAT